jgi:hypothetical protein
LSNTPPDRRNERAFVEQHDIERRRIARRLNLSDLIDAEQRERHAAAACLRKSRPTTALNASSKPGIGRRNDRRRGAWTGAQSRLPAASAAEPGGERASRKSMSGLFAIGGN